MDYLTKPVAPIVLKAKVAEFVALFKEKERARRAATQLRLLVEGTTEYAIFMLDPEGNVVTWNPGAERIKGYRAEEIIGKHFSCFYPPEGEAPADGQGMSPDNVATSFYHSLGIDAAKEYRTPTGRPVAIVRHGSVIRELFAG